MITTYNYCSPKPVERTRAFKSDRRRTVSYTCSRNNSIIPQLRIDGKWLKDIGFDIGTACSIHCENGKLIIEAENNDSVSV